MWQPSKKWQERQAQHIHGVVRFDVFCAECGKQLGEDVEDVRSCAIQTDKPMDTFCGRACIKSFMEKGNDVFLYGWRKHV